MQNDNKQQDVHFPKHLISEHLYFCNPFHHPSNSRHLLPSFSCILEAYCITKIAPPENKKTTKQRYYSFNVLLIIKIFEFVKRSPYNQKDQTPTNPQKEGSKNL